MPSDYPQAPYRPPEEPAEIEFDPHAPFWVGRDADGDGPFVIFYADEEAPWFGAGPLKGWSHESHAQDFADRLNERWYLRFEDRGRNGFCKVCFELHEKPA